MPRCRWVAWLLGFLASPPGHVAIYATGGRSQVSPDSRKRVFWEDVSQGNITLYCFSIARIIRPLGWQVAHALILRASAREQQPVCRWCVPRPRGLAVGFASVSSANRLNQTSRLCAFVVIPCQNGYACESTNCDFPIAS